MAGKGAPECVYPAPFSERTLSLDPEENGPSQNVDRLDKAHHCQLGMREIRDPEKSRCPDKQSLCYTRELVLLAYSIRIVYRGDLLASISCPTWKDESHWPSCIRRYAT
jgi:hypothetical protein